MRLGESVVTRNRPKDRVIAAKKRITESHSRKMFPRLGGINSLANVACFALGDSVRCTQVYARNSYP